MACTNFSTEIVLKITEELDKFISVMNELKHSVRVVYIVKRRCYGAKVIVVVRNQRTSSTIMYSLSKLRSLGEIPMFQAMLDGMKVGVYKFVDNWTRTIDLSGKLTYQES